MKQEHVHFDGLLKPEILDKLKILKGGELGPLYSEGGIVSFCPDIKIIGEPIQDFTTHQKNIFPISYVLDNQRVTKYLSLYPIWEERGNCYSFQVELLDALPFEVCRPSKRLEINWFAEKEYIRTIKDISFYGNNRNYSEKYKDKDTECIYHEETIEFMVFTFTNQRKIFIVSDGGWCLEIYFDLDISIAEFIKKQGYEKKYDESEVWKIILQHRV